MKSTATLLVIALTLISFSLRAQINQYSFDHIGTDDGLSTGTVNCVFKDSRGYVWIGTLDGLNRYNAYDITVFKHDPKDGASIVGNRISSITEDKYGRVWIGTRGNGISVFDWTTESFTHFRNVEGDPKSLASNAVYVLMKDSQDRVLIGTGGGLNVYNDETNDFVKFTHNPNDSGSLSNNTVLAILEDAPGKFWVSCLSGSIDLFDLATGNTRRLVYDPTYAHSAERKRILKDSQGTIWVGTDGQGIYKVNPATGDFTRMVYDPYVQGLNHNIITFLHEMKDGKIWIGTDGGGINVYDPAKGTFSYIRNSLSDTKSLSSDAVYNFHEDASGIIWISTFRGGVNYYSPFKAKFTFYKKIPGDENSLSFNSVIGVAKGPDGKVWLGTDGGGLDLFDPKTGSFEHDRYSPFNSNSISSDVIKSIYTDHEGNLWTGTYAAGVTRYNPKTKLYTRFYSDPNDPSTLAANNVWSITEDAQNRLWLAALGGGLDMFHPESGTFSHYYHDPEDPTSLSSNQVIVLFNDSRNNLWIGTEDKGLCRFVSENGTFERFHANPDDPTALPNGSIRAIYEDSKGVLYIGTAAGFCVFDANSKTFATHPVSELLASDVISGMLEDKDGKWWISTSFGMSRYDPATGDILNFDKSDGLQGNEFNYTSSVATDAGYMIFGGTGGFNVFKPESIVLNDYEAPVALTDFSLFGKSVQFKDSLNGQVILDQPLSMIEKIELTHIENVFSIEFTSLDCTNPSRNKYRYQLDGFDEDWIEVGADKRRATYMNLSPGEYMFHVRATNSDGIWSDKERYLQIKILPPWWSTWWFRVLVVIVVVGCLTALYKWRVKALKTQRLELQKQVAERTAGLEAMMEVIKSNSGQITEVGKSLKAKSGQLAIDASTQDENAREIEEALAMISSNTKKSTENAHITNEISETTVKQLERIRTATLKNIDQTKMISRKMLILEELFKQTNILAINASIEAKRAGQAGTGFSVIAGEVRKLAEKSKEASDEIIQLARNGEKETEEVGALIMDFIPEVQRSARLIHEISSFSKEQDFAVDNVFSSLKSFFGISKKNADVSGEIHEISSELDGLANYLNEQVNRA